MVQSCYEMRQVFWEVMSSLGERLWSAKGTSSTLGDICPNCFPSFFVIAVRSCPGYLSFKSTFWDRRANLVDHLGISSQGKLVKTGRSNVCAIFWLSSRNGGRAHVVWGSTDLSEHGAPTTLLRSAVTELVGIC